MIKKYINARLDNAGLAKVEIIRAPKKVTVDIHTSRPGIVIGRRGAEVDKLREELQLLTTQEISLNFDFQAIGRTCVFPAGDETFPGRYHEDGG
jgi:small subunit ribosomal protein S3